MSTKLYDWQSVSQVHGLEVASQVSDFRSTVGLVFRDMEFDLFLAHAELT